MTTNGRSGAADAFGETAAARHAELEERLDHEGTAERLVEAHPGFFPEVSAKRSFPHPLTLKAPRLVHQTLTPPTLAVLPARESRRRTREA